MSFAHNISSNMLSALYHSIILQPNCIDLEATNNQGSCKRYKSDTFIVTARYGNLSKIISVEKSSSFALCNACIRECVLPKPNSPK